ncbi:MAG TPA: hypothetical protein VHE59_11330 [Mucilaginibacter sp.]|nr:hypothetical protein [Mucilaginibacter sp.]
MSAQDSTFLSGAINRLNNQPAQERVYLHLDKPNYGFGDTIWYKAYTVIGPKHQPSALSGVLYAELISPSDSLVSRQIIPLVSGIGWSDMPLPVNLKPGNYRLRAYTRWMRNFGADAFDEQRVMIGGIAPATIKSPEKYDVQFFPEGGELVDGVRSRVAIKAIGTNGFGKDIKGTIEDNTGNIVADFSTRHLGMGVFALTPEAGKRYKAMITITGETAVTADLPAAKAMGYTFGVNNSEKDSIYVKVATNEKTLAADKGQFFYILAQSNGRVYYTASGRLEGTTYTASIARSRLPEGIAQFTLFSQTGEPLAERIVFIENKADEIDVTLSTNSESYKTHGKVTLNLIAKDSANKPVTGSFSVAVINESKVNPDESNEYTILNKLLLSSELKGYIEQPNYYFTNQSDKTRADLDLLMLTQGYRRYDWKQILTNPTNTTYLPERTQELAGTITTLSGKPLPNSKITLAVTRQNIFRDTIAGENGRFVFTGLDITDTAVVVIKASKANKRDNVKIIPERQDYPQIAPANYPTEVATADTTRLAIKYSDFKKEQKDYVFKNGRMLKTVTIKGYRRPSPPKIPNSSNLHGGGNADQVIMYDQMGDGPDLASRLTGKINFVTFSQGGTPLNTRTLSKMAIIVDGITLSGDHLGDINPDDVYSIEVLRTSFAKNIYGSSLPGDGALIITTKRGVTPVDPASIHPAGLIAINYAGLYKAKAFYTPKYSALPKHNGPPDKRTTIYWNQNILTDKDGKATIDFYNNDNDGKYRVVVEGIDDNGQIGRQTYHYNVN